MLNQSEELRLDRLQHVLIPAKWLVKLWQIYKMAYPMVLMERLHFISTVNRLWAHSPLAHLNKLLMRSLHNNKMKIADLMEKQGNVVVEGIIGEIGEVRS